MSEKYNKIGSDISVLVSLPRDESFEINYDYEVKLADLSELKSLAEKSI